jgi:signal peptidase
MHRVVALLVVALLAVAVAPPPTPLSLSHVTSDSMAPTLSPGDGYLLVAGDVSVGDVVTYRTVDGGYVTHRAVGRTDGGWLTRGDANPATDQAAGAPPVPDERVVGRVLSVGGTPLSVPGLGPLTDALNRYRLPLLLLTAAALAVVLGTTAAATTERLVYVATETATGGRTVPVGEAVAREVRVRATALPLTTVVASATGADVVASTATASNLDLTLALPARSSVGASVVDVAVGVYPAVLPRPVLAALHALHPLAARGCVGLVVTAPFAAVYLLAFDGAAPLRDPRSGRWFR